MKRRRALQALITAPVVQAQELSIVSPEAVAESPLRFFSAMEMPKLKKLAAEILPSAGGRPGAVECGVPEFLDFLLSRSNVADQQLYRQGLAAVTSLEPLNSPWTYKEPSDLPSRFLRRLKEDVLKATFNSRQWISSAGRRGGGTNYYWKPFN